ncbi:MULTISPECIES: hypothetical protein [unclassified Solwaraspora]|uniref:hypothetical protein n=1 Tax=unclassified Solwaraspora TaxID=2627926 RepID=UPI00259B4A18|nr:hypothetical protein [Solwaraspora sp. WMMA2056]WJK43546.1 hypothetical protein O7608_14725 [Solwaraspora sp. WMMA2056]
MRRPRRWPTEVLRWSALGGAVVVLATFLLAQRQSVDVSYGQSPARAAITEGSAGELSDATVPSVEEMTALVAADPVVRLPGAVADWDTDRVAAAIGDTDVRILVAPPGLDEAERDRVREVDNATVRIIGTQVSGGFYQAYSTDLDSWRGQFATGDVTGLLTVLITALADEPKPTNEEGFTWRDPTPAELAPVVGDLRTAGWHAADGATLADVPRQAAATAFPDGTLRVVALPAQPYGEPVPNYGPALAAAFPGDPVVVQIGNWIEYHGPSADEFAEVAAASFYGQFADRLSRYDYPQATVLGAYLNRITDVRYAGLFDRPLPYQPFDPLRVALPALPWLFAACVVFFLALSVRAVLPAGPPAGDRRNSLAYGAPAARAAGLTALAVELSALAGGAADAPLTRGIGKLQAARQALGDDLPDRHVHTLLDDAEDELDATARLVGLDGYRPDVYLRSRLG